MKKASDLYSLTRRELILLEMFNMLDDEEQVQRLCSLSGYLLGRKILSEDDSMKYLREIKKTDSLFNCQSHGCTDIKRIYISSLGLFRFVSYRLTQ